MNRIVDCTGLEVPLSEEESPLVGAPRSGLVALDQFEGIDVGVWEITPGTVGDTECDELFVVLSGRATLHFADRSTVELVPGSLVRLHEGEQTIWEVHEKLRKVYLTGGS